MGQLWERPFSLSCLLSPPCKTKLLNEMLSEACFWLPEVLRQEGKVVDKVRGQGVEAEAQSFGEELIHCCLPNQQGRAGVFLCLGCKRFYYLVHRQGLLPKPTVCQAVWGMGSGKALDSRVLAHFLFVQESDDCFHACFPTG